MKTSELKLGDIVRYKCNSGYYMDMTVVSKDGDQLMLWRPYIWLNQDGTVDLKAEKIAFHVTSNMEWEIKSRRPDLDIEQGRWHYAVGDVGVTLVVPNL